MRASPMEFRRRRRRPDGFTLVEVLIVAALFCTLLSVGLWVGYSGERHSRVLDFQAVALRSVQLLEARLSCDIDNIVPGPLGITFSEPSPQQRISLDTISDRNGYLGLPLDVDFGLLVSKVEYVFRPLDHMVYRNGESIKAGPFQNVTFTFYPSRPNDPTPPHGDVLMVDIEIVPSEAVGSVGPQKQQARFRLALRPPQATANHAVDHWCARPQSIVGQ